jgi:hypothetical protein
MDVRVTCAAYHQGLAVHCCHLFRPGWFLAPIFAFQVGELADMVDFDIFG